MGDRSETARHRHHAIEISIALDGTGLRVHAGQVVHAGTAGVVVRSATDHRLAVSGPKVAVIYVDPLDASGAGIHAWLGDRASAPLPDDVAATARPELHALLRAGAGADAARRASNTVVAALAPRAQRARVDPRIRRAMKTIAVRLDDPPTQLELAQLVRLSPSRFGHLFTREVGISMRHHVLWMKLRVALTHALSSGKMAHAAHDAGFADAAHLTRTCQRMFGLPPSAFAPADAVFVMPAVPP